MSLKILYLTFYFEPDLCAGSFRNTPLAKELARKIGDSGEVHVVTTSPNRYISYKQEAPHFEQQGNLFIHRIKIPSHSSGIIDQARSFTTFFRKAIKVTRGQHFDLVFASSSRLFTAFLGKMISRSQKAPLYLDIRDVFVDTIAEVVQNKIFRSTGLPFIRLIERYTFSKANHINLISKGFEPYFTRYKKPHYSCFSNGIDPEFLIDRKGGINEPRLTPGLDQVRFSDGTYEDTTSALISKEFDTKKSNGPKVKNIVYAGNMGSGQGLEKIIPPLVKALLPRYKFMLIGDGGTKKFLEKALQLEGLSDKVVLLPPMNREDLIRMYRSADYLFLHLNDYKAFEKVLPSKIFDYGAFDVPIIAGVAGFARHFIMDHLPNSIVFEPNNPEDLILKLKEYNYQLFHRQEFINNFSRDAINRNMAESILAYAKV